MSILAPLKPLDSQRIQFYSDASAWGCAVVFGHRWFQVAWNKAWQVKHIDVLKFVLIFLALATWGIHFRHSALTFRCDNQAVVEVLNADSTRDPDMLCILQAITLLAFRLDINIWDLYFPGKLNVVADKLSRSQAHPDFLAAIYLFEAPTPLCATMVSLMKL